MNAIRLFITLAFLASRAAAGPIVHDDRLELRLVASDPQIVTPIGLAIDRKDRLYVIESHTHQPPPNYPGPKADRIKIFDSEGHSSVFAEGFINGMNLVVGPDDELFIVCSHSVEALRDTDNDGRADQRRKLLELKTSNNHSHSALLGITLGPDGWLYISRGNNGSAGYTIAGSNDSRVSGYGDGGNIVRCRLDGSQLEEYATGFWNPFDIKFDTHGRLLCVDNDPDARGPNRLLQIVPGGNYGYKSIYGGAGNHPFQAWEGEIPGTLPMIDGTGEAPSGLIDAARTSFPPDYANDLLVTIWGENTITRHRTRPAGSSLSATHSVLVSGGPDFRPVALAASSKGDLYITDWVLVDYPNHGRGRIWRLSPKTGIETLQPNHKTPQWEPPTVTNFESALRSSDPFIRHAGVIALTQKPEEAHGALKSKDSKIRLGALLALRRNPPRSAEEIVRTALSDAVPEIRRIALVWAGEAGLTSLRPELDKILRQPNLSAAEFLTYLAAVECLDPEYVESFRSRKSDKASQLRRKLPEGLIESIIRGTNLSTRVRSLALTRLPNPETNFPLLQSLLKESPALQTEAIRSLARIPGEKSAAELHTLANETTLDPQVRAEAIAALSWHGADHAEAWTNDSSAIVRKEAARLLRRESDPDPRPTSLETWQQALATGGDPLAGARVFFSARTMCSQCHTVQNRGGALGPDLSGLASSIDRAQIIHSILKPSDQFPPQYQAWFIETKDGELHEGLQLDHAANGALELLTASGRFEFFPAKDIASYGTQPRSLMPDGLEQTMTIEEFRDLAAFLSQLK